MDVALDANAYLADPKMEGVAFRSLFDYLRRTDSLLIIPKVALDEVTARFPERLVPQVRRAISEVGSLRNLVVTAKIAKIPEVDVDRETAALRRRLLKPSKNVRSKVLKNFAVVDVEEVALRGAKRMPPANAVGEQLRDVILWLMVLGYAKKSGREVALITADKHFRQEEVLHPDLAKEVRASRVGLRFAISIDEFIKAHAPKPRDLTEDEAFELCGKSQVLDRFEVEIRRYSSAYWRSASSIDVTSRGLQFERGALYDVGPDSKYGEVEFSGELELRITTAQAIAQTVQFAVPSYVSPQSPSFIYSSASYGAYSPGGYSPQSPFIGGWAGSPPINFSTGGAAPAFYGIGGQPYSITAVASDYKVAGRIILSLRVVSGRLTHVATERVESVKVVAVA